jgi:dTDP-4-dehydrorhamnose reductase
MDSILVIGAETVVGANFCVHWSDRFEVHGRSKARVQISGCQISRGPVDGSDAAALLADVKPCVVVLCTEASRSSWDVTAAEIPASLVETCIRWARAAQAASAKLVMISSDAVFSGPWMFHDEESECFCPSQSAQTIRTAEAAILKNCPGALIARANPFGWSPMPGGALESLLATIESRRAIAIDPIRHATPILATDLAELIEQAVATSMSGACHFAGAERVSPLGFAQRLAAQYGLPWLPARRSSALTEPPAGFGAGECSLETKKLRTELCVPMPLLGESFDRLEAQQINGHRERLAPHGSVQLKAA